MSDLEVKNGDFVYRDAFFVELEDGKRHPRAAVSELKELLMPKKGSTPGKDQTARWYEAQLVHYGLPRVKDKNASKMRLIAASNAATLVVPNHIQKIEADSKKAYTNAQRKAKLAAKKEQTEAGTSSAGKKRKATEVEDGKGSSSKISIKIGDIAVEIDHGTLAKARKKQTKTATPASEDKSSIKKATAKKPATKKAESKLPKSPSARNVASSTPNPAPASSQSGIGNHTMPKQTARRARPLSHTPSRDTLHREPTPMSLCSDDNEEDPPPYSEGFNSYAQLEEPSQHSQRVVQISGSYTISENSPTPATGELQLRLYHDRNELWGRFSIGDKFGLLLVKDISGIASEQSKSFGWRSEDAETGDLRFGRGCDGYIQFDGQGAVRGAFYKLMKVHQDVEFYGQLQESFRGESDGERHHVVEEMEAQWHAFPDRAYGRR